MKKKKTKMMILKNKLKMNKKTRKKMMNMINCHFKWKSNQISHFLNQEINATIVALEDAIYVVHVRIMFVRFALNRYYI